MKKLQTTKIILVLSIIGISYAFMIQQGNHTSENATSTATPVTAESTHHHSQSHHSHHHGEVSPTLSDNDQFKLKTGQGDFVFSYAEKLPAAFPEDAKAFEAQMHGGFNEDPETGIVYTGIPGYGLCSISPDLKE